VAFAAATSAGLPRFVKSRQADREVAHAANRSPVDRVPIAVKDTSGGSGQLWDANEEVGVATSATDRVRVVQPGQTYAGRQGLTYGAGASAETVGAEHICMNVLPMPDKARAKVHYHQGIETIAYLLEGECAVYFGDSLEHRAIVRTRGPDFRSS
jgi:hypothetical protein